MVGTSAASPSYGSKTPTTSWSKRPVNEPQGQNTRSLMRIGVLGVGGGREWRRAPKIGVSTHLRPMGPSVIADLDTLLIALYVELTDQIIPTRPNGRRAGPGRPPALTDAELVCLAVGEAR